VQIFSFSAAKVFVAPHRHFCNTIKINGLAERPSVAGLGDPHARSSIAGVKPSFLISEIDSPCRPGGKRPPRQT
jgi:hypothetical protein